MVKLSNETASQEIAIELVNADYQRYFNGGDSQLSITTKKYVRALQEAASQYEEKHPVLNSTDFTLLYHDMLAQDLYGS